MTDEERRKVFENFMLHGMNITPFKFMTDVDKKYFFTMYEEYLSAMSGGDIEYVYNKYLDLSIYKGSKFICSFYMDSSYSTLKLETDCDIDDEDLIMCMTMMFLTIKELNMMIETLSKVFTNASISSMRDDPTKDPIKKDSGDNRKFVSTSQLPSNVKNTIEKISKLQKSILSENEKYQTKRIKKDKEDK